MFKWLIKQFSADGDDPDSLGSEKGLEAFIARMPETSPANAVEALSERFEHADALDIGPQKLRRALKRIDEAAQEPLAALWSHLFDDPLARTLNDTTWLTLARYYRNVHAGYRVCLQALPERSVQSDSERADAVLIAGRAMAALGRYKTLLKMRYRDVEPGFWGHVMELATWSSKFGGSSTLIELYPRGGAQSSFEREYLIALLFEAAPFANLLPPQMVALDLMLRRFCANYQFSDHYRDSTPFVIDLEGDPIARRWLKGLNPREGLRFFGVASAYAQIAALRKQARANRLIPSWLADAKLDVPSYRMLLDLLVSHWSVDPPLRLQRRTRSEGEILVTHGVNLVRRMIAAAEYAKSGGRLSYEDNTPYDFKIFRSVRFGTVAEESSENKNGRSLSPLEMLQKFELEGDRQMTERWTISDVSDAGLGASVHAHGGWARIGMLVGFRRMDSLEWQVGIIQRLSRSSRGRLSVGLKLIAAIPYCARLRVATPDSTNSLVGLSKAEDAYHDCILLKGKDATSVLLEPAAFAGRRDGAISFDKRWHPVKLEQSLQDGYDYEQIAIRVLSEAQDTELKVASQR